MSIELKQRVLLVFCLTAGLMDGFSGCLLMFVPELALKLMQVAPVAPEATVFIRFVGAFVFGVGSLYLFSLLPVLRTGRWSAVRFVLLATAWLRGVIFVFTSVSILSGALAWAWLTVPLTDGVLAVFQLWVVFLVGVPGHD